MVAPLTFYAAEIEVYVPGATTLTVDEGWGIAPWGLLAQMADTAPAPTILKVSDTGYRTQAADAGGVVPYPPYLTEAFAIDRSINLAPAASSVGSGWGQIEISNVDGSFTDIGAVANSDGRPVRVLYGSKPWDNSRGIRLDPAYGALTPAFIGVATPWFLSDTALSIPLRDATYWMEQPLQAVQYLGTGGYQGSSDLAGQLLPKARGGTATNPIRNVTPILVDGPNQIYQYNDGPGTVVALYSGGATNYPLQGDTNNLYAGQTNSGYYRTDNSRGLFQLGTSPSASVTADVTGAFPDGSTHATVLALAKQLMLQDMQLPPGNLDAAGFDAADAAYPYVAGIYFAPSEATKGDDAVATILGSIGAKLIPKRSGLLSPLVLRRLPAGAQSTMAIGVQESVSLTPTALPDTLDPPPYRWRVAYNHNYTVQTTGVLGSASAAQQTFVAAADRYAAFSSNDILNAYRRPNDGDPVTGCLLAQADAQAVANDLGALWGVRRRLYSVPLPADLAAQADLGDIVLLTWPADNLRGGKLGYVVGEQFQSQDAQATLSILVAGD